MNPPVLTPPAVDAPIAVVGRWVDVFALAFVFGLIVGSWSGGGCL